LSPSFMKVFTGAVFPVESRRVKKINKNFVK
jgi:hypothetical protein